MNAFTVRAALRLRRGRRRKLRPVAARSSCSHAPGSSRAALIYAIIGILALKLALGHGGKLTNQQGALHTVAHQPFGKVLLTLVAIGLGGYSLWRLVRAAIGHGPEGSDTGFDRLAALASGIAYGAICAIAIEILLGPAEAASSGNPKKATAGVFGWPGGHLDRRHRRRRDDRRRALPGLPGRHEEVPRRLEDRGDGPADRRSGSAGSGRSGISRGWSSSGSSGSS